MQKNNHHDSHWHAIDEIWINGQGRATVWSSDGKHVHQQSFQLGDSDFPTPMSDHRYRHDGNPDPVLLSSVADAFQLADAVLSSWPWQDDLHLPPQYRQRRPIRDRFSPGMDADGMGTDGMGAEALDPDRNAQKNQPNQDRHLAALYETIKTWRQSISSRGHNVASRLKAAGQAAWRELTR